MPRYTDGVLPEGTLKGLRNLLDIKLAPGEVIVLTDTEDDKSWAYANRHGDTVIMGWTKATFTWWRNRGKQDGNAETESGTV